MGCGVVVGDISIAASTDNFAITNYNGSDGDFFTFFSSESFGESFAHKAQINFECHLQTISRPGRDQGMAGNDMQEVNFTMESAVSIRNGIIARPGFLLFLTVCADEVL